MKEEVLNFNQINELALNIAKLFDNKKGGTLGLIGDLGTGKTTFTKQICKYFNVTENVKSPTFTYVIEYISGTRPIYHFDVYRIINSEEIYEIGFEDYVGEEDSVVIVEWANNIIDEMPDETLYIDISHNIDIDKIETRKVSVYKLINGEKKYVNIYDNNSN